MHKWFKRFSSFLVFLIFSLLPLEITSQALNEFFSDLMSFNYEHAKKECTKIKDSSLKLKCLGLTEVLYEAGQIHITVNSDDAYNDLHRLIDHLANGYQQLYTRPYSDTAYKEFNEALFLAKNLKLDSAIKFCLVSILELYNFELVQTNDDALSFLNQFKSILKNHQIIIIIKLI